MTAALAPVAVSLVGGIHLSSTSDAAFVDAIKRGGWWDDVTALRQLVANTTPNTTAAGFVPGHTVAKRMRELAAARLSEIAAARGSVNTPPIGGQIPGISDIAAAQSQRGDIIGDSVSAVVNSAIAAGRTELLARVSAGSGALSAAAGAEALRSQQTLQRTSTLPFFTSRQTLLFGGVALVVLFLLMRRR